ncbi:MAG: hypothetical protein CM15mP2_0990 [Methanobacteriota archaeon]|nr:MAG: hypothetical protein CM15mP2_0990 [Euryarchaeota archaeon]
MAESNFATTEPEQSKLVTGVKVFKQIWREMTLGVGFWGALRPLVAALLAAIPFVFLGHHFNRKHQKGFDLALLQIPLALTVVLWFVLWAYSIFDAWREATKFVAEINN